MSGLHATRSRSTSRSTLPRLAQTLILLTVATSCASHSGADPATSDTGGDVVIDRGSGAVESGGAVVDTGNGADDSAGAAVDSVDVPITELLDSAADVAPQPTNGPLTRTVGDRFFRDRDGEPVPLMGSHTWGNLVEFREGDRDNEPFDFDAYLDGLATSGQNVTRLWTWEQSSRLPAVDRTFTFSPNAYARPGPGTALDGRPAFDVDQFDREYFQRLRSRARAARDRGIYVSVMLFNGWSLDDKGSGVGNACEGHPFNAANNVNGVDVDLDGDGRCTEAHTLAAPDITARQERYVEMVVESVGDLDNVLYEISNESPPDSEEWQYHMIDFVRSLEADRPLQHPVGMTVEYPDGSNDDLLSSSADWIGPNDDGGFRSDPPPASGTHVIVLDTDHLWGMGGDASWVWRAATRGYNVWYMDCYEYDFEECEAAGMGEHRAGVIDALGRARAMSSRLDLDEAEPLPERCTTGYCMVDAVGDVRSALVYAPDGGSVGVELGDQAGAFVIEQLDVVAGTVETYEVEDTSPVSVSLPEGREFVVLIRSV